MLILLALPQFILLYLKKDSTSKWIFLIISVISVIILYKSEISEITIGTKSISFKFRQMVNEAMTTIDTLNSYVKPLLEFELAQGKKDGTFDNVTEPIAFSKFVIAANNYNFIDNDDRRLLEEVIGQVLYAFSYEFSTKLNLKVDDCFESGSPDLITQEYDHDVQLFVNLSSIRKRAKEKNIESSLKYKNLIKALATFTEKLNIRTK
jgi:hypothetical protein